jgi:hypothetical protein
MLVTGALVRLPGVAVAEAADMGSSVTDTLTPLILDLLEWLATKPRSYAEVMDAWRTSCPRLPVWEEAGDRGLVVQRCADGQGLVVELTPHGRSVLQQSGRLRAFSPGPAGA